MQHNVEFTVFNSNLEIYSEVMAMMNIIWPAIIIFSFFAAAAMGNMSDVSAALIEAGNSGVQLGIKLLGMLCLWSGLMKIASRSGLTEKIGAFMYPALKFIFPGLKKNSETAGAISMNLTANILGLGNAATPLGIKAMKLMNRENKNPLAATDNMIFFVVMNTAAMHIIPTTVAMLRSQYGSAAPMEIMPAAWFNSFAALAAGLTAAKLFSLFLRKKEKY